MKRRLTMFIILGSALLGLPRRSPAQETKSATAGGFETTGSITAGYRFTDIGGRRQKFAELFSLRSGFRVHEINLVIETHSDEGMISLDRSLIDLVRRGEISVENAVEYSYNPAELRAMMQG